MPDYWGADIPVNKGRNNFDEVRYEYYRDPNVAFEAFKAGRIDLRVENSSRFWATGYEGPALDKGLITKLEIPTEGGSGMQAFVFNYAARQVQGPAGASGAVATPSTSSGPTRPCSTVPYTRTDELLRQHRAGLVAACRGRTSWRCSSRYRDRLPPEVFEREYRRR